MRRRLIFIACVASTAIMASWLDLPRSSSASHRADPVIGRLVGRDHQITITSAPDGPRYSVIRSGKQVASDLTLSQLAAQDPAAYEQVSGATAGSSPASWAGVD